MKIHLILWTLIVLLCLTVAGLFYLKAGLRVEDTKAGVGVILSNTLLRNRAVVEGNYYVSDSEVRSAATLQLTDWFWEHPTEEVASTLHKHPWIKRADVSWSIYPLELKLKVVEREPWFVAEFPEQSWLVSREGILIQPLGELKSQRLILLSSQLPRLSGLDTMGRDLYRSNEVGKSSDLFSLPAGDPGTRFRYGVEVMRLIELAGGVPYQVSLYKVRPDRGLEIIPDDILRFPSVVIAPTTFADAERQLAQLAVVLKDIEARGEQPRELDLRFEDQAILRVNPE